MDSPADALLALSNTAAAIADSNEQPHEDDDRSSSLSELEIDDAPDNVEMRDDDEGDDEDEEEDQDQEEPVIQDTTMVDGDSEAETERLEESPDKTTKKVFQISPSKLAQTMTASDDVRPEIEELTNSGASSPITPPEDSPLDDLSEAEDLEEPANPLDILSQAATVTNKRKRLSDVLDITSEERPRKRRTQSLSDPEEESESEPESEKSEVEKPEAATRESTVEAEDPEAQEKDQKPAEVPVEDKAEELSLSDSSKNKKPEQYTRSRSSRRGKDPEEAQEDEENEAEASDEEAEGDDVDAVAKTEEEQAKRAAAMDALTALEKHFATLRDKLYDEKISQLNLELSQLSAPEPTHPELLRQFDCVNKYRDEKQDTEQTLLVFKVGALKRKSVAERAQIHSAYFQTIRDVRERHMEKMSEHFYRIQRERFKSTQVTPTYTIPFPDKKLAQVTQQTAYNKEVSILSGVAKYVGFPAAPELTSTPDTELNADLQKMGITQSSSRIRNAAASASRQHALTSNSFHHTTSNATSALSSSAAAQHATSEQQFIESTPWANPNHPIHRLDRLGRQNNNRSPFVETYSSTVTPSQQRKSEYTPHNSTTHNSGGASTIPENPTPQTNTDLASSAMKQEPGTTSHAFNFNHNLSNGVSTTNGIGDTSISPTETRRTINNMLQAGATAAAQQQSMTVTASASANATPASVSEHAYLGAGMGMNVHSSPLQARASLLSSLNRTASASPFRQDLQREGVVSGGNGMGRFGFR
ncbi:hypothetical protein PMZ80_006845 [Knufia obscura]|uniref:Transcriptional regulatory protein DEP1 n=1 Tax=Knufia obscura TaxID=1635080 RepID=A0ABR0RJI1_9EURO|nr:hypothetical protein PMZ80_006845 [Knufia obscura]